MRSKENWIRLFIVLGITIGVIGVSLVMIQLLYPFLIALILAIAINPLVSLLEKYTKLPRGLAVLITMVAVFGGLGVGIFFLTAEIIVGIQYLINILPSHLEYFSVKITQLANEYIMPLYTQLTGVFNGLENKEQQSVLQQLQNLKDTSLNKAGGILSGFLQAILDFILWIPSLATSFIFGLLGTFFISKDWDKLKNSTLKLLPKKVKTNSRTLLDNLKGALLGWVKAQAILISITTVTVLIGLLILDVEHAITIALLIGFVDILPILGTGFVLWPWAVYSFISGNMFLGIGLVILYLIIVIQRNLLEPKILSSTIGLNTFATIIFMYLGIQWFGFLGLIIGPVILVIINTFIQANIFKDIWRYIQGTSPESR